MQFKNIKICFVDLKQELTVKATHDTRPSNTFKTEPESISESTDKNCENETQTSEDLENNLAQNSTPSRIKRKINIAFKFARRAFYATHSSRRNNNRTMQQNVTFH